MSEPVSMYTRVLDLAEQCAREGRFAMSHHLFAAAMHDAEDREDLGDLDHLKDRCVEIGGAIDAIKPAHMLSTARAHARGTTAVFASLATTVGAARSRVAAEQARHHAMKAAGDVSAGPTARDGGSQKS